MQTTSDPAADADTPAGFRPVPPSHLSGFIATSLGLRLRNVQGRLVGGFRVARSHLNPGGTCHGGLIATVCDMLMPMSAIYELGLSTPMLATISLSVSYVAPSLLGNWIETTPEILKVTRSMVFAQSIVRADGVLVARADGVFKLSPPTDDAVTLGWMRALLGPSAP